MVCLAYSFFNFRIKNSILAAGSAITQTFDGPGQDAPSAPSLPSSYHGYPPRNPTPPSGPFGSPPGTLYSQKANPAYTQEYSQPPPQHSQLPGSMQDFHGREHAYPAAPVRNAQFPPQSSDYSPEETNESGLFNKIKTFLGPDEVQANIPASLGSGYHYTESQYSTLSSNPPLPQRYENTYYSSQPPRHPSEGLPPASSGFFEPPQQQSYTGANPSKWPLTDNVGIQPESVKFLQPPDFSHIPNDPQIFNFEESVVMILKPRDFYR